jgi:hypothetical protein
MANYVLLETIQLTQNASSIVFDNIPATGYTDLKIVASARSQRSIEVDGSLIRFNGDTTAGNYTSKRIYGSGTAISSDTTYTGPFTSAEGATAKAFAVSEAYIPNYSVAGVPKIYYVESASENNAANAYVASQANLWSGTAAITSITLTPEVGPNFMTGSTFGLYAVAALNTTPVTAPKATGGNIVANDGTYWYHAFLSSGAFIPQTDLTCNALVIAGGGSGGAGHAGGGGGAGGVVYNSLSLLSNTSYTATIGAGGAAVGTSTTGTMAGINGTNSVFSSITAAGGGGGAGETQFAKSGGSGGGGNGSPLYVASGSTYPSGQGNAGGIGSGSGGNYGSGGGGGGAGAVGSNASGTGVGNGSAGAGGAGTNAYSAWATVTTTGVSGYFAGGGGGGFWGSSTTPAAGGAGGGGAGGTGTSTPIIASPGIANTGGGGGGSRGDNSVTPPQRYGAAGGSGIVIIRYPMA